MRKTGSKTKWQQVDSIINNNSIDFSDERNIIERLYVIASYLETPIFILS